jgi:hypothetical protein
MNPLYDDRHLPADEVGRKLRQSIVLTFRPPIFGSYVPAFHIAGFV